jgi:hypothetical protein
MCANAVGLSESVSARSGLFKTGSRMHDRRHPDEGSWQCSELSARSSSYRSWVRGAESHDVARRLLAGFWLQSKCLLWYRGHIGYGVDPVNFSTPAQNSDSKLSDSIPNCTAHSASSLPGRQAEYNRRRRSGPYLRTTNSANYHNRPAREARRVSEDTDSKVLWPSAALSDPTSRFANKPLYFW